MVSKSEEREVPENRLSTEIVVTIGGLNTGNCRLCDYVAAKESGGCYIVRDDSEKYVPRMDSRSCYERFGGDHLLGGGFLAGDRPRIGPEPDYDSKPESTDEDYDWIWDGPFGPMDDRGWMWIKVPSFKVLEAEEEERRRRQSGNVGNENRRERVALAAGNASKAQIQARWEYYGNRCYICGAEARATDHVIPLAKGGSNWPANLRPICKHCNSVKQAQWPYDFGKARREAKNNT